MIPRLVVSIAVPVVLGWCVIDILSLGGLPKLFQASLATGVGLGIRSIALFGWMLAIGQSSRGYVTAECAIAGAAFLLNRWRRKRRFGGAKPLPSRDLRGSADRLLAVFLTAALVLGAVGFIAMSQKSPYGGWDAWGIWNMHARFLFLGGHAWRSVFNPGTFGNYYLSRTIHLDYPLLLPAAIAGSWLYVGSDTALVPIAIAFLFTFGTIGMTVSTLSMMRNRTQGLLGGMLLLGTPYFMLLGAYQGADVPLGFYLLASLCLLTIYDLKKDRALLILCGGCVGFAAWTKNEGILMLLAVAVGAVSTTLLYRNYEGALGDAVAVGKGMVLPLLALVYFKCRLAPPDDLVAAQGVHRSLYRLTEVGRYPEIGKAFLKSLVLGSGFGDWVMNIIPLLGFYGLLVGRSQDDSARRATTVSIIALATIAVGYYVVYLESPYPLAWNFHFSLARLLTQLWPSTVFVVLMLLKTPEEAV